MISIKEKYNNKTNGNNNLFKKNISLKHVTLNDSKFLYFLYNKNIEEKKAFTEKKIDYLHHLRWLKNKINKKKIFIVLYKKERIGYIRFEFLKYRTYSISIAIVKSMQRKKIGKIVLQKALIKFSEKIFSIVAKTNDNNKTSKNFFLKNGFKKLKNNEYCLNIKNEKIY